MSKSDLVHINGCAVLTHTHSQSSARYRECLTGKPIHDKGRKKTKKASPRRDRDIEVFAPRIPETNL